MIDTSVDVGYNGESGERFLTRVIFNNNGFNELSYLKVQRTQITATQIIIKSLN